ncbi:MAG: integrase core domain-containing protein [bacterium]
MNPAVPQETRQDGLAAIVPVVDCGDSYALVWEVSKSQEASVGLFLFEKALKAEVGTPKGALELGAQNRPRSPVHSQCEAFCFRWRIEHTLALVRRPMGNAAADPAKAGQRLKVELVYATDWQMITELREAINVWLENYHHSRPHQALNWQTPAERTAKNLSPKVELAA